MRALASDPVAFGSTHSRELAYADELWRERTARSATSNESALFVADGGERGLVGMVAIAFTESQWHVFAMWVAPEYRRQGLGGQLLDAGLTWFRSRSSTERLVLEVNPRQGAAVRLYERRGFRRTDPSAPLGHAEGETTIGMALDPLSSA